jgi:hypothetical protein
MPLPADYRGASRPASWIAGFELRQDPTVVLEKWAAEYGFACAEDATDSAALKSNQSSGNRMHQSSHRVPCGMRPWRRKCYIVLRKYVQSIMSGSSYWVELYLAAPGCPVDDKSDADRERKRRTLSTAQNNSLNDLLRRFDRPSYAKGRLKYISRAK